MNIFILDSDPIIAAKYHCDKHVNKMILETAQLLSTAHRVYDGVKTKVINPLTGKQKIILLLDGETYKWEIIKYVSKKNPKIQKEKAICIIQNKLCYGATHLHHPSCLWIRQSSANYYWSFKLLKSLLDEYEFRYDKIHKTSSLLSFLSKIPQSIPVDNLTPPLIAMDDKFKVKTVQNISDAVINYRNYYKIGKKHLHKWTKREQPEWI